MIEWRNTLLRDDTGRTIGTFSSGTDITERSRVQEQLRLQGAALNAAANAIVITDRAGAIQWSNPAFSELTGYTAAETTGRDPGELVKSGRHDRAFYQDLWETILSGQVWRGEMINRRKDDSLYTEEQTITPVRDGGGSITHFIAVKQDTTERNRIAEEVRQRARLSELTAAIGVALRLARWGSTTLRRGARDASRSRLRQSLDPQPQRRCARVAGQCWSVHAFERPSWQGSGRTVQDWAHRAGSQAPPHQQRHRRSGSERSGMGATGRDGGVRRPPADRG
jgi:PAS domain S-box-containing protein